MASLPDPEEPEPDEPDEVDELDELDEEPDELDEADEDEPESDDVLVFSLVLDEPLEDDDDRLDEDRLSVL